MIAGVLGGVAGGASAAATPPAIWYPAHLVQDPEHNNLSVSEISCTAPGDCTAAGNFDEFLNGAWDHEVFVVEQRNDAWGPLVPVPGVAALNTGGSAQVSALSCTQTGDCVVGGEYTAKSDDATFPYVAVERNGTWGAAREVPHFSSLRAGGQIVSLDCRPGYCLAIGVTSPLGSWGSSMTPLLPFVTAERNGTWSAPIYLPGFRNLDADSSQVYWDSQYSVSCPAPSDCVVVGNYEDTSGGAHAFASIEKNGTWGSAHPLPGAGSTVSDANSLSCASVGDCIVGGDYTAGGASSLQPAVWQETAGAWQPVQLLASAEALSTGYGSVNQVACVSPTICTAAGYYGYGDGASPFAISEANGVWRTAQAIGGLSALGPGDNGFGTVAALSCWANGYCTLGGVYPDGGYVVDETHGTWQKAQPVPGIPAPPAQDTVGGGQQPGVTAISCTAGGFCGAGGVYYTARDYVQYEAAFLVTRALLVPTTTAVTMRPAKVTYGSEQAAKLTVRVAPPLRGTPTGKVTVTAGKTTICVVTLKSGTGTCALAPKKLGPGSYAVTARYGGNGPFTGSVSGSHKLTVVK